MSFPGKRLHTDGVVVIPTNFDVKDLRAEFDQTLCHFSEFQQPTERYVMGGFSALGNPGSFHNPLVRKLRQWCMATLMPVFSELCKLLERPDYKLEQIVDRMMFRPAGAKPSHESWHRDEAPSADPDDLTFGGWINLDDSDQFFSCVPETHHVQRGTTGFGKIDGAIYASDKACYRVPSGSIVLFYEHIVHEVVSRAAKHDMYRLFLGWRLTTSTEPLILSLDRRLETQAIMPLKSQQMPPMYAALHWINWRNKLQDWATRALVDVCLVKRQVLSGRDRGKQFTVPRRHMKSLRGSGLPRYRRYASHERAILRPARRFSLLKPGRQNIRIQYSL